MIRLSTFCFIILLNGCTRETAQQGGAARKTDESGGAEAAIAARHGASRVGQADVRANSVAAGTPMVVQCRDTIHLHGDLELLDPDSPQPPLVAYVMGTGQKSRVIMANTATVPTKQGAVATVDVDILAPPNVGEYTLILLDSADPSKGTGNPRTDKKVLVSFPLTVKPKPE